VTVRTRARLGRPDGLGPAARGTRGRGGRFNRVGQATTHPARCVSTPGPVAEKVPDDTPRPTEDRLTPRAAPGLAARPDARGSPSNGRGTSRIHSSLLPARGTVLGISTPRAVNEPLSFTCQRAFKSSASANYSLALL